MLQSAECGIASTIEYKLAPEVSGIRKDRGLIPQPSNTSGFLFSEKGEGGMAEPTEKPMGIEEETLNLGDGESRPLAIKKRLEELFSFINSHIADMACKNPTGLLDNPTFCRLSANRQLLLDLFDEEERGVLTF